MLWLVMAVSLILLLRVDTILSENFLYKDVKEIIKHIQLGNRFKRFFAISQC